MTTITSSPLIHSQLVKATCFLLLVLLPHVDMIGEQQGGRKSRAVLLDTGQVVPESPRPQQYLPPQKRDNKNETSISTAIILGDVIPGSTVGTFLGGGAGGLGSRGTIGWHSLSPTLLVNNGPSPSLLPASAASSTFFPVSTRTYHHSGETSSRGSYSVASSFLPTSTSKRHRHLSGSPHNALMTTVISATIAAAPASSSPSVSPQETASSTVQQQSPPPPKQQQSFHPHRQNLEQQNNNNINKTTTANKEKSFTHHQKKSPLSVVEPPVSLAVSSSSSSSSSARNAGPYFESNKTTINVSAREGQTVMLDCAVALLQGRTVSWLRRRKDTLQLLTVGNTTYLKDSRLGLKFRYPNNWRLGIDSVTKEDEGEYQCQLSTHPIIKTLIYHMKVIAPAVIILDENGQTKTERHYKVDSSLHLTCKASHVDKATENRVTWLKGGRALPLSDKRINVRFEKNPLNGEVSAYLSLSSVNKGDSGNYTCRSSSMATSTIVVHVLNGELPAAVQHESCANKRLPLSSGLLMALASAVTTMMTTTTAMSASIIPFFPERLTR